GEDQEQEEGVVQPQHALAGEGVASALLEPDQADAADDDHYAADGAGNYGDAEVVVWGVPVEDVVVDRRDRSRDEVEEDAPDEEVVHEGTEVRFGVAGIITAVA